MGPPLANGNAEKEDPAGKEAGTKSKGEADGVAEQQQQQQSPVEAVTVQEALQGVVALLDKSVRLRETRPLLGRLLRQTASVRKRLSKPVLLEFVRGNLPPGTPAQGQLVQALGQIDEAEDMEVEGAPSTGTAAAATPSSLPEVEMYAYLLVLMYLSDKRLYKQCKEVSRLALARLSEFNRRTLDFTGARIYFYYSLAHEKTDSLAEIRSTLLALHRTAVLRHDSLGQETLLNLLLRNYLHYKLYDQAEKFRSKAQKQDQFRSHQQYCRYLFYLGCIRTIQLEYSDAKEALQQAVRKAPGVAHNFRVAVNKWLILVRLLLGEIPERVEFAQPRMQEALRPYFELTTAVRGGDLKVFSQVASKYAQQFRDDKLGNLITRLHHNVIRTGLRRTNVAYSHISIQNVAAKLQLSSPDDAMFIVAKAIRDGGIDATIDMEKLTMRSLEVRDVYSSREPQDAFHARIAFCLDLHNEAIKAMRFEPGAHKRKLETAEERKERLAQELELANTIAEDEDQL